MKRILILLFKTYLFWLLFFLVNRILFSFFYFEDVYSLPLMEVLKIIPNSIRLDLSFISYFTSIFLILAFVNSFITNITANRIIRKVYLIINYILLIISGMIIGGEAALYSEWNTKLNYIALSHFRQPSEVFATASLSHTLTFIFFLIPPVIFSIFLLKNLVVKKEHFVNNKNSRKNVIIRSISFPLTVVVVILLLRGGWHKIPINTSDAYFSSNIILNDIAVNPNWNVAQSIFINKTSLDKNPYEKHPLADCKETIDKLYHVAFDSTTNILKTNRPNIVFVLLEGWSADNIESLGGFPNITPNFNELKEQGYLFNNFYSNGWTTDQGMASIFSSFPVFSHIAIANHPDKSRKLPSLNKNLEAVGYNSSYFFGGQLTYGNIKSYLMNCGFQKIKDEEHYGHLPGGNLGVHDEHMFNEFHNEINQLEEPFITCLFTLSSHSPYDHPKSENVVKGFPDDKYVNSVAYTDKCLGSFFDKVKKEKWYDNTLFIIVADHSHSSPKKWKICQKEYVKIPMLWYGEVIKDEYKNNSHHKLGSHLDISKTLLSQLGIPSSEFIWGKNLFNPFSKEFVPYTFHGGIGWMRPFGNYSFSINSKTVCDHNGETENDKNRVQLEAEMFYQFSFDEYLNL